MIRETAHNATTMRGEKIVLKPLRVGDVAGFARRDQKFDAISLE